MAKKAAKKKAAKAAHNDAWPTHVEGQEVTGETACGNCWIVKGDDGPRHVPKYSQKTRKKNLKISFVPN